MTFSCICAEYYKKIAKQTQPRQVIQVTTETVAGTYYNSKMTTTLAVTTVPRLAIVEEAPLTVVLVVAVCCAMTTVLLAITVIIFFRNCQHHAESDDPENDGKALCGCCQPLLGSARRQQVERLPEKHHINVAVINDSSSSHSGIGAYTIAVDTILVLDQFDCYLRQRRR